MNTLASISAISEFSLQDRAPEQQDLARLAALIEKCAPHDGRFGLSVPGVHIVKGTKNMESGTRTMAMPGICLVAQGCKSVSLSDHVLNYNETRMVVYAAEVPVSARIVSASPDSPYLCLVIHLDPQKVSETIMKVFPNGIPKTPSTKAIYASNSSDVIVKSAIRLMEVVLEQENADLLAPLVIDEILIRLFRSSVGPEIAQIGLSDSVSHKVARAITWLKENYDKPMKVEELADIAGMSSSSLYSHFKNLTTMSPLQFQKTLRLHEARTLMLTKMLDVSQACYAVGYSSVSQFSREYTREFGVSPSQDKP